MTNNVEERAVEDLTSPERFAREVVEPCRPVILRGLVRHWPVVEAGERSARALKEYLSSFDTGAPVEVFFGAPAIAGKYFYNEDLSGFNFERRHMSLSEALELMVCRLSRADAPSGYVGSVPTEDFLPGFAARNPMPLPGPGVAPRIWLGHAANVSCHHDTFDNLACVVAGV